MYAVRNIIGFSIFTDHEAAGSNPFRSILPAWNQVAAFLIVTQDLQLLQIFMINVRFCFIGKKLSHFRVILDFIRPSRVVLGKASDQQPVCFNIFYLSS